MPSHPPESISRPYIQSQCLTITICLAQELAEQVKADYGTIDILVHSLANGPEVRQKIFFAIV